MYITYCLLHSFTLRTLPCGPFPEYLMLNFFMAMLNFVPVNPALMPLHGPFI